MGFLGRLSGQRGEGEFVLVDAEQRRAESPETFEIPPSQRRQNVQPGDFVKLIFELVSPDEDQPGAERMWVHVLSRAGETYSGELENEPAVITSISRGDTVHFGPEHVIAVYDEVD